jgi:hypothetical protein
MGNYYRMELKVPANLVTTIFDLLKDDGLVVNVTPLQEETKVKPSKYANGKKNKGITGAQLVLSALKHGACAQDILTTTFVARGFSPNSCHAACSKLIKEGKVTRTPNGHYALV